MRELVAAAEVARKALIDDMRAAAGLGVDDPIVAMARGEPVEAAA